MNQHRTNPRRRTAGAVTACGARLGALLATAALASALAALPAGAQPTAKAATHSCSVPRYPGQGYFTSLKVSGTGCSTGSKLAVAYYHCRTHSSARGACHSTVMGFTCHEKRVSIPTEIDGRVTCTRGSATVIHTFQQNV